MAETLVKIRVVAATAFQETLRRKVLWVVLVLMVLIGLITVSSTTLLRLATAAGEAEVGASIRSGIVSTVLSLWSGAAMVLALFLGAVGLSSETTARTIVGVLARPIDRWAYLTGRWMGVLAFLWTFELTGIALALLLAWAFHAQFAPTLWLGLVGMLVNPTLLSGVSLALSVVVPPILAGIGALLLPMLPDVANLFATTPRWFVRGPALLVYYLSPAKMPANLIGDSFSSALVHPTYGLYGLVLSENALYAVAVFALGCAVFARRELTLR